MLTPTHPPQADGADTVVGLAVSFQFPGNKRLGDPTPPSRTRRLDDQRPGEGSVKGLNTDQIAQRIFSAAKLSPTECVVDGQSYVGVSDERVRGQLVRLFGPRLSTVQLESNLTVLERAKWGWVEGTDNTLISLERDVATLKVAELCMIALSLPLPGHRLDRERHSRVAGGVSAEGAGQPRAPPGRGQRLHPRA